MTKEKYKSSFKRNFRFLHFPILPYFLVKDTVRSFKKKQFINSIGMLVITIIFLALWGSGYALAGFIGYQAVKQQMPKPSETANETSEGQIDNIQLFKTINNYREENNLARVNLDRESCDIAVRIIESDWWAGTYNLEEYRDLCPQCNGLGVSLAKDITNLDAILTNWKNDDDTEQNLNGSYKYGCVESAEGKIALVYVNKSSNVKAAVNTDPVVDCKSTHPDCYGETLKLKQSQCSNIFCCGFTDGTWKLYPSEESCKQAWANKSTKTNYQNTSPTYTYTPPTYYSCTLYYPALNTYTTYDSLYETKEECDSAQQSINNLGSSYTPPPTISSEEVEAIIKQCKNDVNSTINELKQRCNVFGGSSAYEGCNLVHEQERDKYLKQCETYGTHDPISIPITY